MLRIAALGPLEISVDGMPLASLAAKAQALLVYLALEPRAHPRQRLGGLLWAESTDAQARASLRNVILQLRAAGLDGFLTVRRETVGLNPDAPVWTDALALLGETPGESLSGLYRGDFLAELDLRESPLFEEWVIERREQLRARAMAVLRGETARHQAAGRLAEAVSAARQLVALDPLQESSQAQLISLLNAIGQPADALRQYEACRRLLAETFGIEPSGELRALAAGIQHASQLSSAPPASLPLATTPFVGRARELRELGAMLADRQNRAITLTGMGGMGKTRLAIEAARQQTDTSAESVVYVDLSGVLDIEGATRAVALSLALPSGVSGDATGQVIAALRARSILIVFDTCEHLADLSPGIGDLIDALLRAAPGARALATSREALNLADEFVFEVGALTEAVALFDSRAKRANLRFSLDAERSAVERICALTQGVPLAIELAAAWTRTLACADIARALEANLSSLPANSSALARQASLRAAFEYSWGMLQAQEQRALADLSIFRGGFTGAAAQAVAQAGLRALNMLAHRSLARRAADGRYDLHPLIRAYAAEYMADPAGLAARMGAFYAGWLSSHRDAIRVGDVTTLSLFSAEGENIAAAWECALAAGDRDSLAVMLDGLLWLTEYRGWFQSSERLFAEALAALPDDDAGRPLRARLLTAQGHCLLRLGRREESHAAHASAVHTLDQAPNSAGLSEHRAFALLLMGTALSDPPEQMRVFGESLSLYESNGDAWGIGAALNNLGECAELLGDTAAAQRYHRASLAHCLKIGDQPGVAFARANLGGLLRLEGRLDEAEAELRAGLEVASALGFDYARGLLTHNLAACAWARRDAPTARRLAEDAQRTFERCQAADRAEAPARLLAEIAAASRV
jgi:DNA-binding SARP family transcriptional activator